MSEEEQHKDRVELEVGDTPTPADRGPGERPAVEVSPTTDPLSFEELPSARVRQDVLFDGVTGEPLYASPTQPELRSVDTSAQHIPTEFQEVEPEPPQAEPDALWTEPQQVREADPWDSEPKSFEPPFVPVAYTPESYDDTARQNGLAYSAGIAFFGSVAFTLFLGWIVDVLLGSSPWGIIGGIIMGSIIGFVQFFSITSRIFPSKDTGPAVSPLSDAAKDSDE